jgi:hypothetical protein
MPRPKYCQHPERHANSATGAKGVVPVCSQLSTFLSSRYEGIDVKVRWLCPRCHAVDLKEMKIHQPMESSNSRSSSEDESTAEDLSSGDDAEISDEVDHDNDEDEGSVQMDNDAEAESKDDDYDHDPWRIDDKENDPESMDKELDHTYDLEYHQNEAMEKLSTIFKLLNIDPIHDK